MSTSRLGRQAIWARVALFASLAVGGTALDLVTKQWVFSWRGLPGQTPKFWLIEPYFGIETAVNPGALFGMGAGFGTVFAILSVLAAVGICVWLTKFRAIESLWLVTALGIVLGGIVGNLYDRLGMWNPPASMPQWQSGVRDWILIQYSDQWVWPNFNIADSLLVAGAIMLAVHSMMSPGESESSAETSQPKAVRS